VVQPAVKRAGALEGQQHLASKNRRNLDLL
jgi:hypothetical protein